MSHTPRTERESSNGTEHPTAAAPSGDPVVDVVILGGGLAGQSLARQLLMRSDRRIVMLDKRRELPLPQQKVGESTVQVGGNYFSKVLDLEEHLLTDHYMKYNLRFYFKTAGRGNDSFEDYGQTYIRPFSNVASYQIDRNKLEAEMLRRNLASPRFRLISGAAGIRVRLAEGEGPERENGGEPEAHRVSFREDGEERTLSARWVVDCSGRGRLLARQQGLDRPGAIRHGAAFLWVDGLVNVEKLTDLSPDEVRTHPSRREVGHLPLWLATTHFMGEGFWFWVIPLQGRTSLGLAFDAETFDRDRVSTPEKFIQWICEEFPLFARDLPHRKVEHYSGYPDFGHDCAQTLSHQRWAMSGEAGRFSDPFYSPGSDLIAIYNTLITDAVLTDDPEELRRKTRAYEQLMRAIYEAYVPSYAESYNALGDAESFVFKYTWELTVYFAFYVFPFLSNLFTRLRFLPAYFRRFAQLGPLNGNLQRFLSGYHRWAEENRPPIARPVFHDFLSLGPLARAEKTFYEVGVDVDRAKKVLGEQVDNLTELARFSLAYLSSVVVDDPAALHHRGFVESIDPGSYPFDPEAIRRLWEAAGKSGGEGGEPYPWSFDTSVVEKLRRAREAGAPATGAAGAGREARA